MAYVVVLLPLLLMLKVPMMVFVLMVLSLLYFKKSPASNLLVFFVFVMGVLAVYLSMYGTFSFRGLSRLKLFLELLVYVLLVVVAMQRLTREINIYLLLSPFLFLALSLFFYHGMYMLFYVVFEVFFLLWMILTHRMESNLVESFKASMLMFMYSLPWVVLLFIFFPRISFEHPDYGFRGENVQRMGHDGTMHLDSKALLVPSDRIVMEIGFDKEVPDSSALYFRGSILYVDKKTYWAPLPIHIKRNPSTHFARKGEKVGYKVTLYPTQKRWIYLLETPFKTAKDATLDVDLISTVKKPIKEPIHYAASSYLSAKFRDNLDEVTKKASSAFNIKQNPKSYLVAQNIKANYKDLTQRASAIESFFKAQKLTYSLRPKPLDLNNSTDSFLFEKRHGYCVHFASSFVTMSRMAGIPSRIVTGYKSDKTDSMRNYLAVKEKDAHAWAELYLDGNWVRVETTATATSIDTQAQAEVMPDTHSELYKKVNLYLMYAKYQVETWILYYSNVRQKQLLQYAKDNPQFIFSFVASFILLLLFTFIVISYFKRPSYSHEALRLLQPLLILLKKEGFVRKKEESMHQYFLRYMIENPKHVEILKKIDTSYEMMVYKDAADDNKNLNALVKEFRKTFRH